MVMDGFTECADMRSGAGGTRQQLCGAERRFLRMVFRLDPMSAALLADMLAQKLMGVRIENTDVQAIPLHLHEFPDPTWRQAVVSRLDFDATVQMYDAIAVLVVTERFDGQRK